MTRNAKHRLAAGLLTPALIVGAFAAMGDSPSEIFRSSNLYVFTAIAWVVLALMEWSSRRHG